jgi:glycosyltransferase involved in cell wall biosynthesis
VTRILFFSRDYTPHDYRFLEALSKTEYQVAFLQLERCGTPLENRRLPENIERIKWAGGRGAVNFEDLPGLAGDLQRVIREWRPDLIHAGPLQSAACLVALSGFQPLVSMSWGYDLLLESGRSAEMRAATRFTLQHSVVMVGDCQAVRQAAISFGMPADRIITFPWGVDLQAFSPRLSSSGYDPTFTILSTRSWEPLYGVDILAQAFVRAARQGPEMRLTMLGDGSMAGHLRSIFEQGGVLERVSFPGQVGQADLAEFYHSADLYVSAARTDGSSVSLLESLACGLPALVSDIPGNREWIESGLQGWLFPDGDVEALARAMLSAVDKRQRLPEMGRAARQLAEERADWSVNFKQLLRAYDLALAGAPVPGLERAG